MLKHNCPNCGAPGRPFASDPDYNLYRCEYCGSTFAWSKPPEEQEAEDDAEVLYADNAPTMTIRRPPRIPTKESR